MDKKQLQERLNKLAAEIRAMGDKFNAQEKRWKDAAEKESWEKLNKDYDEARAKMDEILQAESVDARMSAVTAGQSESRNRDLGVPGLEDSRGDDRNGRGEREGQNGRPDEETRALALAGYFRGQLGYGLDERHVTAMRACRMHPGQTELRFSCAPQQQVREWQRAIAGRRSAQDLLYGDRAESEQRALNNYTLGSGAALIPGSFVRSFELNMLAFGGMRQVAETIVTQSGEEMSWPTGDDTSNVGEQIGEGEQQTGSTEPTFALLKWRAYKFSSKPLLVDYSLLEDSFMDLPTLIGSMLGERIGRITNRKYTYGVGGSTPRGIMVASELGRTTAGAAITYDDVLRLEHSVDPAYRSGAGYMLHDTILLAVRLLKDGQGQYLWQNGIDAGKPDTLNGHPLTINQDMDSATTTTKKVLLFGQLNKYKIRRVREIRLYRMVERYRDSDQDGFIALVREDGNLLNAGTCPTKYVQIV